MAQCVRFSIRMLSVAAMFSLALGATPSAYAFIIDGDPGDWDAIAPFIWDKDETEFNNPEGDIPNDMDIEWVSAALNPGDIYFLVEVYDPPPGWEDLYGPNVFLRIGIDTDNDPVTGGLADGISGIDSVIWYYYDSWTSQDVVETYTYDLFFGWVQGPNGQGALGEAFEICVGLDDLNIGVGTIGVYAYLDNASEPPDDITDMTEYQVAEPSALVMIPCGLLLLLLFHRGKIHRFRLSHVARGR